MSILVIDDDPRRLHGFVRAFGGGINTASSHDFAAHALRTLTDLTTIYLDFDGVDGERLARLMADEKLHTDARVVIHSSNYVGAIKMRDILAATHRVEMAGYSEIVN